MDLDQNETLRCIIFNSGDYTIICTLVHDLLKIRFERSMQNLEQVLLLSISSIQFPDYLRHTPCDTPRKLFEHIEARKGQSLKLVGDQISFRINEGGIVNIPLEKFVKVKQEDLSLSINQPQFSWDLDTIHANDYSISRSLEKKQPGWTQITGLQNIGLQKQYKIRIKYVRYGGALSIGIGIMTKSRKKCHYSGDVQQQQSIGYWSRNGYKRGCICSNGVKVYDWDCLLFNNQRDILQMTFNPFEMTIFWDNGHKKIETKLQEDFINKQLYLFVVMHDIGSKIQLLQ